MHTRNQLLPSWSAEFHSLRSLCYFRLRSLCRIQTNSRNSCTICSLGSASVPVGWPAPHQASASYCTVTLYSQFLLCPRPTGTMAQDLASLG
jgi:hypothetical protein